MTLNDFVTWLQTQLRDQREVMLEKRPFLWPHEHDEIAQKEYEERIRATYKPYEPYRDPFIPERDWSTVFPPGDADADDRSPDPLPPKNNEEHF